jgi:hypothetical protein
MCNITLTFTTPHLITHATQTPTADWQGTYQLTGVLHSMKEEAFEIASSPIPCLQMRGGKDRAPWCIGGFLIKRPKGSAETSETGKQLVVFARWTI